MRIELWRAGLGASVVDQLSAGSRELYNSMPPDIQSTLLSTAGFDPAKLDANLQAYASYIGGVVGSFATLAQGNTEADIGAVTSLVSSALVLSGNPELAIAASFAGDIVSSAYDAFKSPPHGPADWQVGMTDFYGSRPYGPTDPNWLTLDDFFAADPNGGQPGGSKPSWRCDLDLEGSGLNWGTNSFMWYSPIACRLVALGDTSTMAARWKAWWDWATSPDRSSKFPFFLCAYPTDPYVPSTVGIYNCEAAFTGGARPAYPSGDEVIVTVTENGVPDPIKTYSLGFLRAWAKANEYALNGWSVPDIRWMLMAYTDAWNRQHPGVQPTNGHGGIFTFDGNGFTFVDLILTNTITWGHGQGAPRMSISRLESQKVNIGSNTIELRGRAPTLSTATASTSTTRVSVPASHTAAKVATGAGIAALGGLTAAGIYAFATQQAMGAVLEKLWAKTVEVFR